MSIIYSLVCKHQTASDDIVILTTYDSATGNYPTVVINLLKKLVGKQTRVTYEYGTDYNFHVLRDGILSFVCMSDVTFTAKIAFSFLDELKGKFKEKFTNQEISVAQAHSLASTFAPTYKNLVSFYNSNQQTDKKAILAKKLTDLKDVMTENIEKILQRQEKVELFVRRAQKTDKFAQDIKANASRIKQKEFCKANGCKIIIVAIVAVVLVVVFVL